MYSSLLNIALPAVLYFTRSRYLSIAKSMGRRQFWTAEARGKWRAERLQELLSHAKANVPFYSERLKDVSPSEAVWSERDWTAGVPMVTKADIQRVFPDGMLARNQSQNEWRFLGTRGTTNRLMVAQDFRRRDHARASQLLALTEDADFRLGMKQVTIPPDACSVLCGIEGLRDSTVTRHVLRMIQKRKLFDSTAQSDLRGLIMNNWIDRATVLPPFGPEGTHIDDDRMQQYVDAIVTIEPDLLFGLPEYLQMLARYVQRHRPRNLKIREMRPMGSNLNASAKREIEDALGGVVREHYGSLELGCMAFDCRYRAGMHLLEDQYFIEVLRHGRQVPPGEIGSIVVTDLFNYAMPLIRYEIGDMGRLITDPCPCGRTTQRIVIEGRLQDTFVLGDGRLVTPETVAERLATVAWIDQFQVTERGRRWEVRFVPRQPGPHDDEVKTLFASLLGDDRPITVIPVESILPETSGKFRHCKSDSFVHLNGSPTA